MIGSQRDFIIKKKPRGVRFPPLPPHRREKGSSPLKEAPPASRASRLHTENQNPILIFRVTARVSPKPCFPQSLPPGRSMLIPPPSPGHSHSVFPVIHPQAGSFVISALKRTPMRLAMTFLALLTVDLSIYDNYDRIQERRERKRHMHPHWPERTPLSPYRISGAECQDAPAAQAGLIRSFKSKKAGSSRPRPSLFRRAF